MHFKKDQNLVQRNIFIDSAMPGCTINDIFTQPKWLLIGLIAGLAYCTFYINIMELNQSLQESDFSINYLLDSILPLDRM